MLTSLLFAAAAACSLDGRPATDRGEEIIIACGAPCRKEPKTEWDLPACADYEFDSALGEALQRGDRSAAILLQKRYETTFTISERHNIAGMLLGKVSDDAAYWTELSRFADDAVRFAGNDDATRDKFAAYCDEHALDAAEYETAMDNALQIAGKDPRSHALLIRALESSDAGVVSMAVTGLALQHDVKSLTTIGQVLERVGNDARFVAMSLVDFQCEEADRLAFKYLPEDDRADYTAAAAFLRATSRDE